MGNVPDDRAFQKYMMTAKSDQFFIRQEWQGKLEVGVGFEQTGRAMHRPHTKPGPIRFSVLLPTVLAVGIQIGSLSGCGRWEPSGGSDTVGRTTAVLEHVRSAQSHEMRRESDAAIKHYELALALDPDVAQVHVNLGELLGRTGRGKEALRHIHDAIRLEP